MREIKFKAWHKAEKVMCDVEIISFDAGAFLNGVKPGNDYYIDDKNIVVAPKDGRFCTWDEIELIEYTGLKDKNGKEIYEGDIMREEHYAEPIQFIGYSISRVDFSDVPMTFTKGWVLIHLSGINGFYKSFDLSEIVGNIYENPELLK